MGASQSSSNGGSSKSDGSLAITGGDAATAMGIGIGATALTVFGLLAAVLGRRKNREVEAE